MNGPTRPQPEDLARLRLLAGAGEELLHWLAAHCRLVRPPAGSILLAPDSEDRTLYCILAGSVTLKLRPADRDVLSRLEAGECFGEMSILEGTAPSAFAVAQGECILACVSGEVLWALIDRSHAVARNLLLILSARLRRDHRLILRGRERQRAFEAHARVDPLTGLYNRRWLDPMLERWVKRHRRSRSPLALLMIDADHFKAYNDRLGHLAGDAALRSLAATVRDRLRPMDAAARFGGEEFVVLLPDTDREGAHCAAERLRATIAAAVPQLDGRPLEPLTVSIGLAVLGERQGARGLLAAADRALYRAKRGGRNRVADS